MKVKALAILEALLDPRRVRTKRLTRLLKDPEKDQFEGWFMYVPRCFNDALDLKQTTRKARGREQLVWTQGSEFSFKVGDTLYDTPGAYEKWSVALRKFTMCVSVTEATQTSPFKRDKASGDLMPRNPGSVRFCVYVPREDKSGIVHCGEYTLTQDDFVRFLIVGPPEGIRKQMEVAAVRD